MTQKCNVLISSVGRRVELLESFRQALAALDLEGQVMAMDITAASPAFQAAERVFRVPPCTEPSFVPRILDICSRHEIKLLIPTIDTELPVYAAHRDEFDARGTTIAVSDPKTVAITRDKIETHAWLQAQGFPTVRQARVYEVVEDPTGWEYPLLVKPVAGSMSRGVAIVQNERELISCTRDDSYIVQTIAPGDEYTVSFLASRAGRCICAIPRLRMEVRGGEVSKGLTLRNAAIEDLAFRICERLPGAYGAMNVQIFFDENTSELNVIEINPRFGGGFPLAWQAGGDFPRWMIEELLGLQSTASHHLWRDRLMMLRYDRALYMEEDALEQILEVEEPRKNDGSLWQPLNLRPFE